MTRVTQAISLTSQESDQTHILGFGTYSTLLFAGLILAGCDSNDQKTKDTGKRAKSKTVAAAPNGNPGAKQKDSVKSSDEPEPGHGASKPDQRAPLVPYEQLKFLSSVEADFTSIDAMAFAPDGKTFVTGGNTPKVWKIGSDVPLFAFEDLYPLTGTIVTAEAIAISADGTLLAIGGGDGLTHLFDFATRESRRKIESHDKGVASVSFSRDAKTLATSGYDGKARVWNAETGAQNAAIDIEQERRIRSAISPDGKILVSIGKEALLWSAETGEKLGDLNRGEPREVGVWAVSFSSDGRQVVTGDTTVDFENAALLWSTETRKLTATLKHEYGVWHLSFSPDDRLLATADVNGVVRVWRLADQKLVQTIEMEEINSVDAMTWTPNGKLLAVASDGTVQFWGEESTVEDSKEMSDPQATDQRKTSTTDEAMADDGTPVAEAGGNLDASDAAAYDGPKPATKEMLVGMIDLPTFPKIKDGDYQTDEAMEVSYLAPIKIPDARKFYRSHFSEAGWEEHEQSLSQVDTDESWMRIFEKEGYFVQLFLNELGSSSDYKTSVELTHKGNVDSRKLPLLPDVKTTYESVAMTTYSTPTEFEATIEHCRKLFENLGWQKADLPERSYGRKLTFRQNAIGLQIDFRKSGSETSVTYGVFAIRE